MERGFRVERSFASCASCLEFLINEYQQRTEQVWLEGPDSALVVQRTVPRFLFRGECGQFTSTRPIAARPETWRLTKDPGVNARLSTRDCHRFEHLSKSLLQRFTARDYDLSAFEALALLQHYGLPTVMIDCTSSAGTAMAFAIGDPKRQKIERGRICVVSTGSFQKGLTVAELSEHPWAVRARRQDAFAVSGLRRKFAIDLKSGEARLRWGVQWFDFPITLQDRDQAAERYRKLVSINDDPTAGILRCELIEYVERCGKLSRDLAK